MTRAPVAALLCLAMVGSSAPSLAKPPAQKSAATEASDAKARELYKQGDRAYAEGRYEEALAKFEEAHRLSGRPLLLFNIGNAQERLGMLEEAADNLEKYISYAERDEAEVLRKRVTNLRKRAEEQKKREQAAAREPKPDPEPEESQLTRRPARKAPRGGAPPEEESSTLPWLLVGAGGAAIAAGSVFGLMALGARRDADRECKDSAGQRLCNAAAEDALDRDARYSLIADIGFGVGIVSAGIGAYLLLSAPSGSEKAEPAPSTALGAKPRPGGGELTLVGRF